MLEKSVDYCMVVYEWVWLKLCLPGVPGSPHAPKKMKVEGEGAGIGLHVMLWLDALALKMKMSLM